jgi:hypothetical protein
MATSITRIDQEVIKGFAVVRQVISSGSEVHRESFNVYALESAELFVEKYSWFYLLASVHKIIIHELKLFA